MCEPKACPSAADNFETELIVRGFLAAFNSRSIRSIAAFLGDDFEYQPRACERVTGQAAALAVFAGLFDNIELFEFIPIVVVVSGSTVLVEQSIRVRFHGEAERTLYGLASFTVGAGVVLKWRQLHG